MNAESAIALQPMIGSTGDWTGATGCSANGRLVFYRSDIAAPTMDDIAILRKARQLLETSPDWDRSDDRNCDNDKPGVVGLYCAFGKATVEQMGKYFHRQPAMQRVRRAIEEKCQDRVTGHRLMDFNNHSATNLEDVIAVLDRAEAITREEML